MACTSDEAVVLKYRETNAVVKGTIYTMQSINPFK